MIKFSIFYPNEEGKKFDMDYYINSHIPMVMARGVAWIKVLPGETPVLRHPMSPWGIYCSIQLTNFRAPSDPTWKQLWQIFQITQTSCPLFKSAKSKYRKADTAIAIIKQAGSNIGPAFFVDNSNYRHPPS